MKIQICSDLHLEFGQNRKWLKQNPLIPEGEVLLIAGDTYYLDKDYADLEFIKKAGDEFENVYIIPGNHEYYGGYDISSAGNNMNEKILSNVHLINNEAIQIGNTNFIFTTLWSNIETYILQIMRGMMDFKMINFDGNKFSVNDYNNIHKKCLKFLKSEISKKGKKVVVTHHLPSPECNIDEFKNSVLNEAFCVDLTKTIENHEIEGWIYGHSHRNKTDFEINKTQMLTNQLGYVDYNEHWDFNSGKTFDIGS